MFRRRLNLFVLFVFLFLRLLLLIMFRFRGLVTLFMLFIHPFGTPLLCNVRSDFHLASILNTVITRFSPPPSTFSSSFTTTAPTAPTTSTTLTTIHPSPVNNPTIPRRKIIALPRRVIPFIVRRIIDWHVIRL